MFLVVDNVGSLIPKIQQRWWQSKMFKSDGNGFYKP